jgi:hypothetical protein
MSTQDKQHRNNTSLTRTLCSRAKEKRHGVISDAIQDMAIKANWLQTPLHPYSEIISTYVSNPYYTFNSTLRLIYSTNNTVYC